MNRVAVTGIGVLSPVGNNTKDFWNAITSGKNGIAPITRFDTSGTKYTLAAEVKDFDPYKYMDKQSAGRTDRFAQYAVCVAEEAVQSSGILENVAPERFGVYFGSGIGGFETMCQEHSILLERGPKRVSPLFIQKMITNIASGILAIRYGAKGPVMSVSTACASGTTAIGEAYRAIAAGYADAILCGGSEAAITPLGVAGFGSCQALSPSADPDAASIPFDKRRSGFVMGEGAGALILEDYDHAVRRGAAILCEVVGYGSTCDAYHVTSPNPEAAESSRCIADSITGIRDIPAERIYYNAHGTGTKLNDASETLALKKVFSDAAGKLHISSTKSMTGHMLGAAGGAEAVAAICALLYDTVPPTINLTEPDPECDLDYTPQTAQKTPLEASLSASFGFGGHNACVAFRKI